MRAPEEERTAGSIAMWRGRTRCDGDGDGKGRDRLDALEQALLRASESDGCGERENVSLGSNL